MEALPDPTPPAAPRRPPARVVAPLLMLGLLALIALSALLDWPRNEPAARRLLLLRAAELDGWLRQELFAPIERVAFAEVGGAADGAPAWREVHHALDGIAASAGRAATPLPPLDPRTDLGASARTAIGARRFTPFESMDALASAEWMRAAHLLARLIEKSPSTRAAPIDPWLDAAVVLASDLRATGLLAPALGAAELEEAVERRLAVDDPDADVDALKCLVVHTIAAGASIPPGERVAERESRLAQACVCVRARVAPFDEVGGPYEADESDPPWPIVISAGVVDRLESYDERLRELLAAAPSDKARAAYDSWLRGFARELPAAAALVAEPSQLAQLRDAPARLQRIRAAAQRRIDSAVPAAARRRD